MRHHPLFSSLLIFLLLSLNGFCQSTSSLQQADWISSPVLQDSISLPCPIFRKSFNLTKKPVHATLLLAAHGIYEATINGQRMGDGYFTPGFTAYHKRLQYQEYDIDMQSGKNDIRVVVGAGWWRGTFGAVGKKNNYGADASILLNLTITYEDGSSTSMHSDSSWEVGTGSIIASDLYHGETFDANKTSGNWQPVIVSGFSKDNLVPAAIPPVRKHEIFKPKAILAGGIIDFGQNLAGWVRFKVKGNKGDTIRIYHAEAMDKYDHLFTGNLRLAKATDTYILKGGEKEIFEPHFTYHGFRYIKLEGCKPNKDDFEAIALYTDLQNTGSFSCSDARLNQLQHNIEWSMKSNFFDIPTDCPQRSERFGWTLDADVFCPTASYLMDVKDFYAKWLLDLAAEQNPNGCVPATVPSSWHDNTLAIAGWGDAAVFTPWTLYQRYGDTAILRQQYQSMRAWVDYVASSSPEYLWKSNGFGDWYPAGPVTDLDYLDQCYFYHSATIMAKTAALLQHNSDAIKYQALASNIKLAFDSLYLDHIPLTQTAYIIGLQFDLLPPEKINNLVALINATDNRLSTGFMGTPYLMHVLSKYGQTKLAYKILFQTGIPSWLYMIDKGATTMWEQWDAIQPDGSIKQMSLNHYAFGSIGSWMYEHITGIMPAAPGYKKILIKPEPGGGLSWAKGQFQCSYGEIISEWKVTGSTTHYHIKIPIGTTARIQLQGQPVKEVHAGDYHYNIQTKLKYKCPAI